MSNENTFEELKDTAEEAVRDAKDAAEAVVEDAKDAAADAAENAEDAAKDAVEDVKDAAEEAVQDAKDAAEEVKKDIPAKAAVPAKTAAPANKSAVKQPQIIKKKKGVNKTTLIAVIVCAVIVLACVGFIGYKLGWFHVPPKASMTMDDYSTIEISSGDVEISEDTVDSYMSSFQTHYNETNTETEGTLAEGDKIHIIYTGVLVGETEPFDGGSTGEDGTDITLGSSGYIDGFDDGLIGREIGSTVDLNLTFPEDYHEETLAGKDVVFTVDIQSRSVTITPELTDEFVKENSLDYTEYLYEEATQINTIAEYREFVEEKLYNNAFESSLESALMEKAHIKSYDEAIYNDEYDYQLNAINYMAQMYGMDAATLASYYGAASVEEYAENNTKAQLDHTMMMERLAADLGITFTDEEVDDALTKYMEEQNLTETYSLDEFKEINGEAWMYIYRNYTMNRTPVLEALKDNVTFVEEPETEAETETETDAAE